MPITALMMQAVRNGAAMAAPSPTPSPSFSTKTQHYTFRSSTPSAVGTDPNDATQATNVIVGPSPSTTLFPTVGNDGKNYGLSAAPAVSTNATSLQAGGNPLLGGTIRIPAGANFFVEKDAGTYDIRIALGLSSATERCVGALFDGNATALIADIGSATLTKWGSGKPYGSTTYLIASDGSIWKPPGNYTSGAVEPSGAGPTFSDNGTTLTRQARSALLVLDNTTSSTSNVIDQNNQDGPASAWAATTPKSVTVTNRGANSGLCFLYIGANNCNVRCISITRTA